MPALGRIGSYATDTPLQQNYVGDALTLTENNAFRYREERRKIAEAKKKEEEDKQKEIEGEYDIANKTFANKISGYSSIDDPLGEFTQKLKDDYVGNMRLANQTTDGYKKAELKTKNAQNIRAMEMLNQQVDVLNNKKKEIEEGVAKGLWNDRDLDAVAEIDKSIRSGKYDLVPGQDGVPRMNVYKVDENGKVIGILEKNLSLADMANRLTPMKKSVFDGENGILAQMSKQAGTYKNTNESNYVTTTSSGFTKEGENFLKEKAKEVSNMPSEAYEIWQRMGNSPKRTFSEEEKSKIADYVYNLALKTEEKEFSKTVDYGSRLAQQKANEEKIKTATFNFNNVRTDDFNGKPVSPNTVYTKGISFSKPIKLSNLGGENSDLNAVEVLAVTKDKKTGQIIFTGKALKTKNAKFNVGGKIFGFPETQQMANAGNEQAQAALSSYMTPNNYGNFTRRVPSEDEANAILQQANLTVDSADRQIEKMNPNVRKESPKKETNTADDFNSKWAKLKPGETLVGPDGKTYKKK